MDDTVDAPEATQEMTAMTEMTAGNIPAEGTSDHRRSSKPLLVAVGVIVVALFAASQVFVISSLRDTQARVESIDRQITDLDASLVGVSDQVNDIAQLAATPQASASPSDTPRVAVLPAGLLPRFSSQGPDQAIGMKLPVIHGLDAYTEEAVTIDPADGTKRVWMIWAHWCPYCQQELPELNTWWPEAAGTYPNVELVSVTTSIDPSRGNPLEEYLAAEQFTFPVIIDAERKIGSQMGVNAFPFWIVTDSDGTVLFRTAGVLGMDSVEQLFAQLDRLGA